MVWLRLNQDRRILNRHASSDRFTQRFFLRRINAGFVLVGMLVPLLLGVGAQSVSANESCPAVLERLENHQTAPDETFTSIAARAIAYDRRRWLGLIRGWVLLHLRRYFL